MHKTWYQELGYRYNPFTIKPGFFSDEVIGYDKEVDKIITLLDEGNVVFLEGQYGQGKTTTVEYIINEFAGKRKVLYVSRNRSDRALEYTKLLKKGTGLFARLFGAKAKNVILLVDETQKINRHDCKQIEKLLESGHFASALFIDASYKDANLSEGLQKRINKNVFALSPISEKDAVELVRSRLDGNKDLISDAEIKEVFEKSGKNTRTFLLNMEEVCRHAVSNEKKKVSAADIKAALA